MSDVWNKFKAIEGTETVVIGGEIFEIRKSLKAKELRDLINKTGSNPQALYKELVKKLVVKPSIPENFDEIWEEMDAAVQSQLIEVAMEKSGVNRLFRLVMAQ